MHMFDNDVQILIKEVSSLKERVKNLEDDNNELYETVNDLMNRLEEEDEWCHPQSSINLPDLWQNPQHMSLS